MRNSVALFLIAAALAAPGGARADASGTSEEDASDGQDSGRPSEAAAIAAIPRHRGLGWDVELNLGVRVAESSGTESSLLLGRLQAGLLLVREPWVAAIGATGEGGGLGGWGLGGQLKVTHLQVGTWGHLGASFPQFEPTVSIAAGWSLVGLEWQRRAGADETEDALFLHVRIPIGTTYFLLTRERQ